MRVKQNKLEKIEIRLAVQSDASSTASVLFDAFAEYRPLYTREAFAATTPDSGHMRDRMVEGPVWVALLNGVIVGTVSAVPKEEALYVRGMAVLSEAKGRGIGKILLDTVENFAYEHSYKRLFLSTTPFLDRAIHLYEHFGFRRNSDGPHDLFGTPLFTMEKMLIEQSMAMREFQWPDDYEAIVDLWTLAGLYNPSSDSSEQIHEVSKRNPGLFLLAVEPERRLMGSVIGTFDGRRGYLYHVAVHPDCRRKGYGTALLREVEQRMWALGAKKVRLMVETDNTEAVNFYKTLGYNIDGNIPMSKLRPPE